MDLYSAEEQIIEAMPSMIDKANNGTLKTSLKEHLKVTEKQKARLEEIQKLMGETEEGDANAESDAGTENNTGFFSRLFGGGVQKCKGMEGLISEGEKMMGEDMSPEVLDAAIIAGAQKIEHYEICGYGTARAYARELNLGEVANKLEETLNEEYYADDLLTELAVGKLNVEAEFAEEPESKGRRLRTGQTTSNASSNGKGTSSKRGTPAKSNRGSNAKTNSGGNGRYGSDKSKAAQGKSSSSSSRSSSKSSAPAKGSATRSSGRTNASKGPGKSSKSTSQAKKGSNSRVSSKKSATKSSSGNRSKSSGSKGSRR
jgi:ferritin-like metal-binding protein YciE